MIAPDLPPEFLAVFDDVYEDGDRILAIVPDGLDDHPLALRAQLMSASAFSLCGEDGQEEPLRDVVFCLDVFPNRPAEAINSFVTKLGRLVRPGGLLFVTALTTEHPSWTDPEPGWEPSGPRSLRHPGHDEHRFFLHNDEFLGLFAAWNVLHHAELPTGRVEAILIKPTSPVVDVATVLYGA